MAIPLECINIIIPLHKLRNRPGLGNFDDFLRERVYPGSSCCYDQHLYRESVMSPMDVELRLEEWKKLGLRPTKKYAGQHEWRDLCVVDSFSGPTLPCSWLEYDPEERVVWSKGKLGRGDLIDCTKTIIFLHGKESTPETSSSAQAIKDYFTKDVVLVPDYRPLERTHDEIEAFLINYIEEASLKNKDHSINLIGISLGGYWAYRMANLMAQRRHTHCYECIMLNPSFRCYPDVPVLPPNPDLLISVVVNLDDDVVDPQDAIERFEGRAKIVKFEKGGHRFANKGEMMREIESCMNTICD